MRDIYGYHVYRIEFDIGMLFVRYIHSYDQTRLMNMLKLGPEVKMTQNSTVF